MDRYRQGRPEERTVAALRAPEVDGPRGAAAVISRYLVAVLLLQKLRLVAKPAAKPDTLPTEAGLGTRTVQVATPSSPDGQGAGLGANLAVHAVA